MPSAGPGTFGTCVSDGAAFADWFSANGARTNDEDFAFCTLNATRSDRLLFTGWYPSYSVPSGATINGIELVIERYIDGYGGQVIDHTVQLFKDGSTGVGTNKASAFGWPSFQATATYGGASDLWGTTWTAAEINSSNFGFALAIEEVFGVTETAYVDYATVTVHYTEAAGGGIVSRRGTRGRVNKLLRM